jgi:hypothetical protein
VVLCKEKHYLNPAGVRRFCMPWLLDPFCFLFACPRSGCAAECSVLACYVLLVGASVADAAVPAGERVLAAGLVHLVACALSRCRPRLVLPGVAPPPSAPSEAPRPKPSWGKAWSPIRFFLFFLDSALLPLLSLRCMTPHSHCAPPPHELQS